MSGKAIYGCSIKAIDTITFKMYSVYCYIATLNSNVKLVGW